MSTPASRLFTALSPGSERNLLDTLREERVGGALLLTATVVALLWANVAPASYATVSDTVIGPAALHLDLTYKEFELLKYLVQHPGRVFTRAQLLQEVWGYDYYGGTRTVDVHVRRLRAKLGPEHEQLIGTVRNVGYRFDPPKDRRNAVDGRSEVPEPADA